MASHEAPEHGALDWSTFEGLTRPGADPARDASHVLSVHDGQHHNGKFNRIRSPEEMTFVEPSLADFSLLLTL
jgi:hypothetical protein